jgi:hypothetical protein
LGTQYLTASPDGANQRLSLDFVSDVATVGRQFRSSDMLAFKKYVRTLLHVGREAIAKLS